MYPGYKTRSVSTGGGDGEAADNKYETTITGEEESKR